MFKVHKPTTSVRNIKPPEIILSQRAAEDMFIITDEVDDEVGGVGTVRYLGVETHQFLVEEIFLPKQDVHSTTTELDPAGMAELMEDILRTREDGMEVVNSIRFWFHSHVNMGLGPSGQDESELARLCEDAGDYFIAARTNKRGEIRFDMMTEQGFLYHDLPWNHQAVASGRRAELQELIKDRVKKKTYAKPITVFQGGAHQHPLSRMEERGKPMGQGHSWAEGLWGEEDWPAIGSVGANATADTGLARGSTVYMEKNDDGEVMKAWIDITFKGVTRTAIIDRDMLIQAEVDPEVMNWAPAIVDLDSMSATFVDLANEDVEIDFVQLDELELEAIRGIFRTEAVKKMAIDAQFATEARKRKGKNGGGK